MQITILLRHTTVSNFEVPSRIIVQNYQCSVFFVAFVFAVVFCFYFLFLCIYGIGTLIGHSVKTEKPVTNPFKK